MWLAEMPAWTMLETSMPAHSPPCTNVKYVGRHQNKSIQILSILQNWNNHEQLQASSCKLYFLIWHCARSNDMCLWHTLGTRTACRSAAWILLEIRGLLQCVIRLKMLEPLHAHLALLLGYFCQPGLLYTWKARNCIVPDHPGSAPR